MLNDSARNRHNNDIYICTSVLDEVLKISSKSPNIRFVLRNLLLFGWFETRPNSKFNEISSQRFHICRAKSNKNVREFDHDNPFLTYHLAEIIKIHCMQY